MAPDVPRNENMVKVGMTHDTAEFAVESIGRWWRQFGLSHYPTARQLFTCADSGGSNAARKRARKYCLQKLQATMRNWKSSWETIRLGNRTRSNTACSPSSA
jgi:hypothetical protein